VTDATIQVIVRCAETDVSTQRPDLMILILDPSTRRRLLQVRMAGVILKRACKTVTDAKIQMIVRCAETDASTQCLDLIVDPSTRSMVMKIMTCACKNVTAERISMINVLANTAVCSETCVNISPTRRKLLQVRMVMKIMKRACKNVTAERISMIVVLADTDVCSTTCLDLGPTRRNLLHVRVMKRACKNVTAKRIQMIVVLADTDVCSKTWVDLILDPTTRRKLLHVRMARVISKCLGAWTTVTDAKTQKIVRCAETDASTQCLDVILDPSTRRKLLHVRMAREIMKCACETVTDEMIQMIVRDAETDAPQCLNLATSTRRKLLDVLMARGVMKCA